MRRSFSVQLAALALAATAATACAKDPTEGKTEAKVAAPVAVAEKAPAAASAEELVVAKESSKIGFIGAKVTAEHVGEFKEFDGKISLADGKLEGGRVEFTVKPESVIVDGGLPKLEGHLKSPDFFDVAQFPTAKFVSTEIKPGSTVAGMTHTVTGNLEMRGTTKSVTFPARVEVAAGAVKAASEFGINRKDFGIQYPGMPDDLIKENVLLKIELTAPRKS
jgi:polyisoprenoid-binding protein YceI